MLLTISPLSWADREPRKEKSLPHTDTSNQIPGSVFPLWNFPLGCITNTPFVVSASISSPSFHLVAFS